MSNVDPDPKQQPADPAAGLTGYRFATEAEFQQQVRSERAMRGPVFWSWLTFPWTQSVSIWRHYSAQVTAAPSFHVPTRFGMSAILGITTALALLFGLLRAVSAHELLYLFFGLLAMIICLVQMRWGGIARQVSVVAGAVLLPLFVVGMAMFVDRRAPMLALFCSLLISVPLGGFLGYLTGACAGGVFLLMDLFEKYWTRRATESRLDGPVKQS
ncbi:hypothetical protein ETAA8_59150 [Anatilimnocola aggregata]|uniref:Uncharacterized protein n=1 Tax=Anatilimnocola aggregata TaxID=2528021 RepID=A0A517YKM5_9BACT|nr:hypothetical protein [Anatilimnocola aggregata]QDU30767.1 hypothetical protein ETAA8_59150 [Anatilimnocola aggregata]